ncbi:Uncharacterized protein TCM_014237 [Theobroma cacao]|uniref:Uncharacterized protein n=1 Tax=Theobroma cacao TaxID=3641 RepID=A0A061FXP9_THECC|nr:Uncharacterized protein TCM_014237 [Theobroma cacao]
MWRLAFPSFITSPKSNFNVSKLDLTYAVKKGIHQIFSYPSAWPLTETNFSQIHHALARNFIPVNQELRISETHPFISRGAFGRFQTHRGEIKVCHSLYKMTWKTSLTYSYTIKYPLNDNTYFLINSIGSRAYTNKTFHLYPSTLFSLPWIAAESCEINGYHIPKGSTLLVNTWAIGRDPNQ